MTWLFRLMVKMQRESQVREKAVSAGLIALLATSLMDIYHRCYVRGYATHEDRHNATRSYLAYHGLGANGEMSDLYNKILALSIHEDV